MYFNAWHKMKIKSAENYFQKTNKKVDILCILIFIIFLLINNRCTKENNLTAPSVTTSFVSNVLPTSCTCGGNVISDGGSSVTARGICWSLNQSPTISENKTENGTGTGSFSDTLTGLTAYATYYVRAYAVNSTGVGYGEIKSFKVGIVTDIDGNSYHMITIGTQIWMAENLKVSKYRSGDNIGTTTPATLNISGQSAPKYLWAFEGNYNYVATYGFLYTWHVVTDARGLCPIGWHVPTDSEWHNLALYLDPAAKLDFDESSIAGGMLKETGTNNWSSPNTGATNETGFSAVPGGERAGFNSGFYSVGFDAYYWSYTEQAYNSAWYRGFYYNNNGMGRYMSYEFDGFSVRCIKD
jgi:uncharacterized protein (TIGR02145 family)